MSAEGEEQKNVGSEAVAAPVDEKKSAAENAKKCVSCNSRV